MLTLLLLLMCLTVCRPISFQVVEVVLEHGAVEGEGHIPLSAERGRGVNQWDASWDSHFFLGGGGGGGGGGGAGARGGGGGWRKTVEGRYAVTG